jgi:hypothetical protein
MTKRPLEADLASTFDGGWIRVQTQVNVPGESTPLQFLEKMPFRAYEYLIRTNPAMGYVSRDKKRQCNQLFNYLPKHTSFLSHMNRPARAWYDACADTECMGHWRSALMRAGVTIDQIMGEAPCSPTKRSRPDPSLPHVYMVVRAGMTHVYHFVCADDLRVYQIQQSIKSVVGEGSEDRVECADYLLMLLCGESPADEPERADALRELARNITPLPGEWTMIKDNTVLATPCQSYTLLARGWI